MAGDAWISALEPIGAHFVKAHLSEASALIIVFAQRYGLTEDGARFKHYVTEAVGIAIGFLISALHQSGLVCLEQPPNSMTFLNQLCNRPANEKPMMILPIGYPARHAEIPAAPKVKKPLSAVLSVFKNLKKAKFYVPALLTAASALARSTPMLMFVFMSTDRCCLGAIQ